MSASERDPRVDPQPGDVVYAYGQRVEVTELVGALVYYNADGKPGANIRAEWPRWMALGGATLPALEYAP